MKVLYKYRSVDKYTLDIFHTRSVYFSKGKELNDPFDGTLLPQRYAIDRSQIDKTEIEKRFTEVNCNVEDALNTLGVYCLSTRNNSRIMWSHYGAGHRGICLGFSADFADHFVDCFDTVGRFEVEYSSEHPFKKIYDMLDSKKEYGCRDNQLRKHALARDLYMSALTCKHTDWSYEEEIRFVSNQSGAHKFKHQALQSVTFGLNISERDRSRVINSMDSMEWDHVKFFDIRPQIAESDLDLVELAR